MCDTNFTDFKGTESVVKALEGKLNLLEEKICQNDSTICNVKQVESNYSQNNKNASQDKLTETHVPTEDNPIKITVENEKTSELLSELVKTELLNFQSNGLFIFLR
jgi:hypothetical protein